MINKKYRANDGKFAKTYSFNLLGWLFLVTLAMLLAISAYERYINDLQSPQADKLSMIPQAQAAEPSVVIDCNNPAGYIRCKFYKGELTEKQAITMIAIGKAESGLRADARNKTSTARGVFQIIAGTWYAYDCTGDKYNYRDNIDCAIKIMKKSGYTPWDAFNRGMHKKFIKDIEI